jgi:hypothetical protein
MAPIVDHGREMISMMSMFAVAVAAAAAIVRTAYLALARLERV